MCVYIYMNRSSTSKGGDASRMPMHKPDALHGSVASFLRQWRYLNFMDVRFLLIFGDNDHKHSDFGVMWCLSLW